MYHEELIQAFYNTTVAGVSGLSDEAKPVLKALLNCNGVLPELGGMSHASLPIISFTFTSSLFNRPAGA